MLTSFNKISQVSLPICLTLVHEVFHVEHFMHNEQDFEGVPRGTNAKLPWLSTKVAGLNASHRTQTSFLIGPISLPSQITFFQLPKSNH